MITAANKAVMLRVEQLVKAIPAAATGERGEKGDVGERGAEGIPGRDGRDGLAGVVGASGTPGEKGVDGRDGRDGKDGADGITLEQLEAALEVKVTELLAKAVVVDREFRIGDRVVARLAFPEYKGVWAEGTYERGDNVTWGGSGWMCVAETTTEKPDGTTKDWVLMIKKGRDGKDSPAKSAAR